MPTIEWGFLIVNYLFLGGLSAGCFRVRACHLLPAEAFRPPENRQVRRHDGPLARGPRLLPCLSSTWATGYRFYKLVTFRWQSPMSIGSWLLLVFTGSVFSLFRAALADAREKLFSYVPKRLAIIKRMDVDLSAWRRGLGMLGSPSASAWAFTRACSWAPCRPAPSGTPTWWPRCLVLGFFLGMCRLHPGSLHQPEGPGFQTVEVSLHAGHLLHHHRVFIVLPYLIHGQLGARRPGSPQAHPGWSLYAGLLGVFLLLGLLVPLFIEIWEMAPAFFRKASVHHNKPPGFRAAILVLVGGYLLRYIFVYAGQISAFSDRTEAALKPTLEPNP